MNDTTRENKLFGILKDVFGYTSFRFEQLKTINSILDGKDTLSIMPTGGGKSLCFQIPALYHDGVCLVISPLISLMNDQVMNLGETGIEACFLNSSQGFLEKREIRRRLLNGELKLVYVSPEAVLAPYTGNFLKQLRISLIAIDEAHCVSQWGHEFRKDYTRLNELKDMFPNVPRLALTATADAKTRMDIVQQLALNEPNVFVSSFDRPNIKYIIQDRIDEIRQLDAFIKENHPEDTGIVYCLSRKKVESVTEELKSKGYNAVPYHAGLSQEERKRNQDLFDKEDKIIVVATIAFGMGIDRPDVRFVAHLDLPKSVENYYQETGRAGRDGKPSSAWMVYGLQDVVKLSMMLETTEADENYKRIARHKMEAMLSLCESAYCRRKFLLNYFGEKAPDHCGNCDACITPVETWDATTDAQKVLSAIYRTNQFFGAGYVIDVLRGSESAKIMEHGHNKLSVYGIGKEMPKHHWNNVIRQLLNMDYIAVKNWEYCNLCLTEKSREILTGSKNLQLRKLAVLPKKQGKKKTDKPQKIAKPRAGMEHHNRQDLFESLRILRSELAREGNVPPYIVFSDKTLHEMCVFLPRNESEFLVINGVGRFKYEKYGEIFLKKIREHETL